MNIYIDVGAYNGDTIEGFKNWSKLLYPDDMEWTIYAFEPNPKFRGNLSKIDGVIYSDSAAWVEDTEVEFAVDKTKTPMGSTLMKSKVAIWDVSPKIKVPAFDFSSWLKQFKDDFVILKMDCEGAEFPILEKMIDDGTIYIPQKLMVEFHPNKVRDYTTTYKNELIDRIKGLGVELVEWH